MSSVNDNLAPSQQKNPLINGLISLTWLIFPLVGVVFLGVLGYTAVRHFEIIDMVPSGHPLKASLESSITLIIRAGALMGAACLYATYHFWVLSRRRLNEQEQEQYVEWFNRQPDSVQKMARMKPSNHDWEKLKKYSLVVQSYAALKAEEEKKELNSSTVVVEKNHTIKRL